MHNAYSLEGGSITIGCDNLESGKRCILQTAPIKPTEDHYDIIAAAQELRDKLPFKPQYLHVEGHQRTKYPGKPLDEWALLNEDMDALAKAYWNHTEHLPSPHQCRPHEWKILFKGTPIVTKFDTRLRRLIEGNQLEAKWTSPSGTRRQPKAPIMTLTQVQSIDTDTIQKAWDVETTQRRRFVTKVISRQLPTGRRMQQFRFWTTSKCPLCQMDDETTEHVFLCQDPRARETRRKAIAELEATLTDLRTATDIRQCLIMIASSQLLQEPLTRQAIAREEIRQLIGRQLRLHPLAIIQGRLSTGWKEAQQQAYRNYAPWKSGQLWATATVRAFWNLAFTIWDSRNQVLHEKQENHPDINPNDIDIAILEEWTIGPDPTWEPARRSLFAGISCEELLNKPISHRLQWLDYIRLARQPQPNPNH